MDIIAQNHSFNCKSHPNENIVYLKVNDFKNNDKIFYCETCIEEVDSFITQNFLRIKNILQSDSQLILKWPPLDNTQIISQIKQIISESQKQNNQNIQNEIIEFFDELKKQILEKIDHTQKSMIEFASQAQKQNGNAIKQLIDFSKFEILQQILKSTNINCMEKEKQLREIINKGQVEKEQNLQKAVRIVNEVNKQNRNNKFELPQHIKQSILNLIDEINFFNKDSNILRNLELQNRPFVGSQSKQQYPKNLQIGRLFDNCIEIKCQKEDIQQFYSDLILEKNKKYSFRFEVEAHSFEDQSVCIGIIDDKIKHLNANQYNKNQVIALSLTFQQNSKMISLGSNTLKRIKGEQSVKEMKTIEVRVDLKNEMVQILDFPNYFHSYSIEDQFKNELTQNHYRLNLYLSGLITVRVKSAFICEQFE